MEISSGDPFVPTRSASRSWGKLAAVAAVLGTAAVGTVMVASSTGGASARATTLVQTGSPAQCSQDQINMGCTLSGCVDDGSCTGCVAGWELQGGKCQMIPERQKVEFYVYRAQNNQNYSISNNNAADLPGVMWYLQNEVVRLSCPRHYNMTRILRYKITYMPTKAVWGYGNRHKYFTRFVAFDKAQCTVPGCRSIWWENGYVPGCEHMSGRKYGPRMTWYSLPGPCPQRTYNWKTPECTLFYPGGECANPRGWSTCNWNAELMGEVSLDEIEGIEDYGKFCQERKREFIKELDHGDGVNFWDDMENEERNLQRVAYVQNMFKTKYPDQPTELEAPLC
mmetsp:Transcript_16522/g.36511  ORF Transcript_16522/g.36511 Transcript_16522/m.36511 type:complete len:338 (+) Transcript_16522:89-1102(+)